MKPWLPIFEPEVVNSSKKFTRVWQNFIWDRDSHVAHDRLAEWNGRLINDVIVFDTEQDKMWFILRWS